MCKIAPGFGDISLQVNNKCMNAMLKKILLGALALVAVSPATPALASRDGGSDGATRSAWAATVTITRDQAVAAAQAKLAGTLRKAKLTRDHGQATWKVRIVSTDGLQRGDFRIDAMTGNVIGERIKTLHGKKFGSSLLEKLGLKKPEGERENDADHRGRGRGSDDN